MLDVYNRIVKSRTPVNMPLTNISIAYLQSLTGGATEFFPEVPVQLSTGTYNIFTKEDLLRDNVRRKPILGSVDPTIISSDTDTYKCYPEQIKLGFDEIIQSDMIRQGAKGMMNIRQSKSKVIAQQIFIHRNKMFAKKFFDTGIWGTDYTGGSSASTSGVDFVSFDNSNSDPIGTIRTAKTDMKRATGRVPNKLGMGQRVFDALVQHPDIVSKVIYGGTSENPAIVTERALAAILGVDQIVVFDAIWNSAELGAAGNMEFICDENSMLLAYATNSPAIDEPTAGYTFVWDMGLGQTLPIIEYDAPDDAAYSRYIAGMMSMDMKKVCSDLGVFFKNAVAPIS